MTTTEIIENLDSETISKRLSELADEQKVLMTLMRAARKAEQQRPRGTKQIVGMLPAAPLAGVK